MAGTKIKDPTYGGGGPMEPQDPMLSVGGFKGNIAGTLDDPESRKYLWAGRIVAVDVETMVCTVRGDTGTWERNDVPLPASGGAGPRSWAGCIPELGSKVIIGWAKFGMRGEIPLIIQFMTPGVFAARDYKLFASADPVDMENARKILPELEDEPGIFIEPIRLKLRKAYPGDFLASSSSGSDVILDRDVILFNRAGNEFRLRDADQTIVSKTLNTFEDSAAGFHTRGLIKRNAFNLYPDLGFDESTDTFTRDTNPDAFDNLVKLGLLKADGSKNFIDAPNDSDPDEPYYPFVSSADGMRVSYVHDGEHDLNFAQWGTCYTEDRFEMRFKSDGSLKVTEEGEGVQIEPFTPEIEDVKGTVVGNDPYTDAGRILYKRILTMELFDSPQQQFREGINPKFSAINTTISNSNEADTKALARLFKINSPKGSSNVFTFAITKEGRTFVSIPKSSGDLPQEKGKSLDIFTAGKVKGVFGKDTEEGISLDLSLAGGLRLDLGRDIRGQSIDIEFSGAVSQNFKGTDNNGISQKIIVQGSGYRATSAADFRSIGGSSVEIVGGAKITESLSQTERIGAGGAKKQVLGDSDETWLGRTTRQFAQPRLSTFAVGDVKNMIAGVDLTNVTLGGITRNVIAGAGIIDTVGTGNILSSVATGNITHGVGIGNYTVGVGLGNLSLATTGGAATLASTIVTTVSSAGVTKIAAPLVQIGGTASVPIGGAVIGVPGPVAPHLDYITGLPIRGIGNVLMGL